MREAILIYNPRAGRWRAERKVAPIREALRGSGYRVEPAPTEAPGHAGELAAEAAGGGVEAVFTLGGDGTLREAAEGLLDTGVPVGPLPGGTTNVIPYSLGLPLSPLAAARAHAESRPWELDVGLAGGEHFLMQASFGLDARTLRRVAPGMKRLLGKAGVALEGLRQWATYDYPDLELLVDGRAETAKFAAVCNLPHFGGSWALAPDADPTDGRLDLVVFRGEGRRRALAFTGDVMLGRHLARPDVEHRRVDEVEIRGPAEADAQLDGDFRDLPIPLTLRVSGSRLAVLVPPRPRFRARRPPV